MIVVRSLFFSIPWWCVMSVRFWFCFWFWFRFEFWILYIEFGLNLNWIWIEFELNNLDWISMEFFLEWYFLFAPVCVFLWIACFGGSFFNRLGLDGFQLVSSSCCIIIYSFQNNPFRCCLFAFYCLCILCLFISIYFPCEMFQCCFKVWI